MKRRPDNYSDTAGFVEGVAFYEAKRQFFDYKWQAKGFSSIRREQLSNISSKTHASNILLYDVDIDEKRARVSSVHTEFVKELEKADLASNSGRLLHSYGDLWVKSIGDNLLGMHLDFRKESVDEIKKLANGLGSLLVILNAAVAMTQILEPKLDSFFIDENLYDKWIKPNEPEPVVKPAPRNDGPKGP